MLLNAHTPRIISASRRTDIPAFYAEWLMNRVRAGECLVVNPFNRNQVSRVSLRPEDVEAIVFWTRNPRPLLPHLDELDRRGFHYYFQYTLLDNPRWLDPHSPHTEAAIHTFRRLSARLGPERLVWRYDPVVLMERLPADFHRRAFERLAQSLAGHTQRVVVSILDEYPKIAGRMRLAATDGGELLRPANPLPEWFAEMISAMAQTAARNGMEIVSCAEPLNLQPLGVRPGACIDGAYLTRLFGLPVSAPKDPSQRPACNCVASKDIGAYDTCLFGCRYCYATSSFETARRRYQGHDPTAPAL